MVKDRRFFTHIFAKDNESQKIFMLKFRITKPKIGHTLREGQKKSKKFLTFSDLCATMMTESQSQSVNERKINNGSCIPLAGLSTFIR